MWGSIGVSLLGRGLAFMLLVCCVLVRGGNYTDRYIRGGWLWNGAILVVIYFHKQCDTAMGFPTKKL
ncbi:BnaC09g18490D [Brassica napus]|uniref:BnaC09g18490D protein n=3 Tax=Brassica TaxID=3705 RepID=A0A078GWZ8_BRANA|nr:BnaC09g18490D [Brassica napus]VDD30250.1 unnamed protein product [Brassica oleracea]